MSGLGSRIRSYALIKTEAGFLCHRMQKGLLPVRLGGL